MRQAILVFGGVALLATLAAVPIFSQATSANLGTWNENLTKSKYESEAPKSRTRTEELFERDGLKVTIQTVRADGTRSVTTYAAHYDGKEYPASSAVFDMVSLTRIDANTREQTEKKAGKFVQTARTVVSSDGKTMTMTVKGTSPNGRPFTDVRVYEKQ